MSVVIIGGGQAGLQVADTLRTEGYEGKIHVIAEESGLPYQRPPLSKDYLAPGKEPAPLPLRGASFFEDKTSHSMKASRHSPSTGPNGR